MKLKIGTAVAVLLGLLAPAVLLVNKQDDGASALPSASGAILLLAKGELEVPDSARTALEGSRRVETSAELANNLRPGDLLIIDRSAVSDADPAILREQLKAGRPIFALNVPLEELVVLTGYLEESGMTLEEARVPARTDKPSYSFVWVSQRDERGVWHNSKAQKDFASGLFKADLNSYALRASGLTDIPGIGGNKIVPLSCLSDPECAPK